MQNPNLILATPEQLENFIRAAIRSELAALPVSPTQGKETNDELGGVKEAAVWINKAPATIYSLTSRNLIPHFKRGKQLYFSKSVLLDWVTSGKRKTHAEITAAIN